MCDHPETPSPRRPRRWASVALLILAAALSLPHAAARAALADGEGGGDAKPADAGPAEFTRVPTDVPVTTMAVTEDGKYLVLAHEQNDRLSVWDVRTGQKVTTIESPAPCSLVCRGPHVFVANVGKGTVTVLSPADGWKTVKTVAVPDPDVFYLSAAARGFFAGEVLATAGKEPAHRSVFALDVNRGTARLVYGPGAFDIATVSGAGTKVLVQANAEHPGSVKAAMYDRESLSGGGVGAAGGFPNNFRAAVEYCYPAADVSWVCGERIWWDPEDAGGWKAAPRSIVIPDSSGDAAYVLTFPDQVLRAVRLDTAMTPLGSAPVRIGRVRPPDPPVRPGRAGRPASRPAAAPPPQRQPWPDLPGADSDYAPVTPAYRGPVRYSPPIAVRQGDRLYLFLRTQQKGLVARCELPAFDLYALPPNSPRMAGTNARPGPADTAWFRRLPAGGVTGMAVTEDGSQLLTAHESQNSVGVWDVKTGAPLQSLHVDSPRFILCRGAKAYIASYEAGAVVVLSHAKQWSLERQVKLPDRDLFYLSAPAGKSFDGRLLATCHANGGDAVWAVDVARAAKPLAISNIVGGGIASCGADAKTVVEQTFEGNIHTPATRRYDYAHYLKADFSAQHFDSPERGGGGEFLHQQPGATSWLGGLTRGIAVPDATRPLYYELMTDLLAPNALWNGPPPAGGVRRVVLPPEFAPFVRPYVAGTRTKRPLNPLVVKGGGPEPFAAPAAATFGGRVYLYVYVPAERGVWRGEVDAFGDPPPRPTPPPPPPPLADRDLPGGTEVFEHVETAKEVAAFELSEDGRTLVAASADRLLVWNVVSGKLIRHVPSPMPVALLWRGGLLYAAGRDDGVVRAYDPAKGWGLVGQFKMEGYDAFQLAAAPGAAFDGKILVATKTPTGAPPAVLLIDSATHAFRKLYVRNVIRGLAVSADRRQVIEQGGPERSSHPGPSVFDYAPYVGGTAPAESSPQKEPVGSLHQFRPGPFWLGDTNVVAGRPFESFSGHHREWGTIAGDVNRDRFYVIVKDAVKCFRIDTALTELGTRPAAMPVSMSLASGMLGPNLSAGDYSPARAVAIGDRLYLFLRSGYRLLRYQTVADPSGAATALAVPPDARGPAPDKRDGGGGPATAPTSRPAAVTTGPEPAALPARIVEGEPVVRRLFSTPVKGQLTLVNGPAGATVSGDGTLTWTPAKSDVGHVHFKARLEVDGRVSFPRFETEVVAAATAERAGGDVGAVDALGVHYVANGFDLSVNESGTAVLLLQERILRVLDADGLAVRKTLALPRPYLKVRERPDYYIAAARDVLDVIDKKTLKVIRSAPLDPPGVADIVPDPVRGKTYVVRQDREAMPGGPVRPLVEFDEATGRTKEVPGLVTLAAAIDPGGRYLYAVGPPGPPDAGAAMDPALRMSLVAYDLRTNPWRVVSTRSPYEIGVSQSWFSIRVSPDGGLVVLTPGPVWGRDSGLLALRASNLSDPGGMSIPKLNVSDVSFHPSLDLAAVAAFEKQEHRLKVFTRSTGKPSERRFDFGETAPSKVTRVLFAPGGRHLLVAHVNAEGRRLVQSFPLRLDPDEQRTIAIAPARPTPVVLPDPPTAAAAATRPAGKVALAELSGLRPGPGKAMTPKEIARQYTDAVVLVGSEHGSGSGFVIGSAGYIVTCAHVIPEAGDMKVSYRVHGEGGKAQVKEAGVEIVRVDKERDLALLKARGTSDLQVAHLAGKDEVEMGEEVTVIGHPGLGGGVLDFTVTAGIVSNPSRRPFHVTYIQTNAAVNPGSSGGPMFNSEGNVIGVVVAKARGVEGVGFAVALKELRSFLDDCVTKK